MLLAGCGEPGGPAQSPGPNAPNNPPQINWDSPIAAGARIPSHADARLAFRPNLPEDVPGDPEIFTTNPQHLPKALREIAWVYLEPDPGRFFIRERVVNEASKRSEFDEQASAPQGCETHSPDAELEEAFGAGAYAVECYPGDRYMVELDSGAEAIVIEGTNTTSLRWLEPLNDPDDNALSRVSSELSDPILEVAIIGPASELTGEEAIEIANQTD